MTNHSESTSKSPASGSIDQIGPMSWWERMFLPRVARITEQPIPLDLPESVDLLFEQLLSGASVCPGSNGAPDGLLNDGALAELALQVWRLRKRVDRIDPVERRKERRQLEDSATRLERVLEDAGVVIDDPIGKPFVDGWVEIEVIAWDPVDETTVRPDFDGPWIKDTIKPIIRRDGFVIAIGQVVAANP